MAKLNELEGKLDNIEKNLDEAQIELTKEIETLREELANTEIPAGASASLDRLTTKAQALANIIPNPPEAPAAPTA